MIERARIKLNNRLNKQMFENAMATLRENHRSLTDFDRKLFNDLESGYLMAGDSMTISVKQMNHIKTTAWEFEQGA